MPEMHLRQPQFVYSACGLFTRHKERFKKFKQTGDTRYICRNELDKACFQHDSAYADHKDLINRTEADKVLRDKVYDIASNPEYDSYQRGLDNIWGVDLANMQSLSKKNKGIKYVLCAIDLYSKYAFVVPLKDKKGISVTNGFNKIIK